MAASEVRASSATASVILRSSSESLPKAQMKLAKFCCDLACRQEACFLGHQVLLAPMTVPLCSILVSSGSDAQGFDSNRCCSLELR